MNFDEKHSPNVLENQGGGGGGGGRVVQRCCVPYITGASN